MSRGAPNAFADFLRGRALLVGIRSLPELARCAGLHRHSLSRLIAGVHEPKPSTVESLARVLACEPVEVAAALRLARSERGQ